MRRWVVILCCAAALLRAPAAPCQESGEEPDTAPASTDISDSDRLEQHKRELARQALRDTTLRRVAAWKAAELEAKAPLLEEIVALGAPALPALYELNSSTPDPEITFLIGIIETRGATPSITEPVPPTIEPPVTFQETTAAVEPGVLDLVPPSYDAAEAGKFLEAKALEARQEFARGNIHYAKRLIEALLLLDPGSPQRDTLQMLNIACDEALIHDGALKATVTIDKPDYDQGDVISAILTLTNVSPGDVRIPSAPPEDGGRRRKDEDAANQTLLQFTLEIVTHDWAGNSTSGKSTQSLQFAEDIVIASGQTWSHTIALDTASLLSNDPVLRGIRLTAYLRPPQGIETTPSEDAPVDGESAGKSEGESAETGETPARITIGRRVTFPTARFRVFPVQQTADGRALSFVNFVRHSPEGPLEVLRKAIDNGLPAEIFLAAHLQRRDSIADAVGLLIDTLDRQILANSRDKKTACMAALARITGQTLQNDPERWLEWWALNKAGFGPHKIHGDY